MPFNALTTVATDAGPTEGASYTACLATARGSSSTAAGDLFLTTDTGRIYQYYKPAGTPGILLPPEIYEDATGYYADGSGNACFFTEADEDLAALVARGWTDDSSGTAAITGGGTGGFVFTAGSGTSSNVTRLVFTGSADAPDRYYLILFSSTTATVSGDSLMPLSYHGDGSGTSRDYCRFSANHGSVCSFNTSRTSEISGLGELPQATDAWYAFAWRASDSDSVCVAQNLAVSGGIELAVEISQSSSDSENSTSIRNNNGKVLTVKEYHVVTI